MRSSSFPGVSVAASLTTLLLLSSTTAALSLECNKVLVGKQTFDLSKLGGPKTVHWVRPEGVGTANTSFTLDLCKNLPKPEDHEQKALDARTVTIADEKGTADKSSRCSVGTRVCGVERIYNDEGADGTIYDVIEIAGEYAASNGRSLQPQWSLLNHSASNADRDREGLRGELHGGKNSKGQKQKAVIEFICDKEVEGTEGFDKKVEERAEDGEEGDKPAHQDDGKALQFVSYKLEDDVGTLRLDWRTRYACDKVERDPSDVAKKAGWGFFTWFLIIAFLLAAAYIIFGSWLNYNRYGARGWDLIPHGDTIRDLPYIVKDLGSGVMDKLRGNGNRGGYSAV